MNRVFGTPLPGVVYTDRPAAYGFLFNTNNELAIVRTSLGLFLPGGGLEGKESPEEGLRRELFEEIGAQLLTARFVTTAVQYHWSDFYQQYFKKIGAFYAIEAGPPTRMQQAHSLCWLSVTQARLQLTHEFQRWSVDQI